MKTFPGFLPLAALCLLVPRNAPAQEVDVDPGRTELSRSGLEALLETYEQTAASSAYSEEMRGQARRESALIRARLQEGDFQVGDQVVLVVEREEPLSNTFSVQAGPVLVLPEIGEISLAGVLRSELEDHLRAQLSRYIRDPVVHARSSIRVVITGGVGRAGFHVFATNALLSDVLMAAGGPAANAAIDQIRIERQGSNIWEGDGLQRAIIEGRTLDQMSLRAGDHIIVPVEEGPRGAAGALRTVATAVLPMVMAAATLFQIF